MNRQMDFGLWTTMIVTFYSAIPYVVDVNKDPKWRGSYVVFCVTLHKYPSSSYKLQFPLRELKQPPLFPLCISSIQQIDKTVLKPPFFHVRTAFLLLSGIGRG